MDVDTIHDQTHSGPRIGQQRPDQPRPAVVQRWHGVEEVGPIANARIETGLGFGVRGHGMPRADRDATFGQRRDQVQRAGELGRQRDQPHTALWRPVADSIQIRQTQIGRIVRPLLLRVDERPLHVEAQRDGPAIAGATTLGQDVLGRGDRSRRRGDDSWQEGCDAVTGQLGRHRPNSSRLSREIMPECAVDLQLDKAGSQVAPVSVDGLSTGRTGQFARRPDSFDVCPLDQQCAVLDALVGRQNRGIVYV